MACHDTISDFVYGADIVEVSPFREIQRFIIPTSETALIFTVLATVSRKVAEPEAHLNATLLIQSAKGP
ncbi:hypothetical protein CWO89_16765 [Bradyrhizobium sp. Leo170]|nr:hypothetical protein CWO89_16765 [Bradyrhizobium sp. Leo170]